MGPEQGFRVCLESGFQLKDKRPSLLRKDKSGKKHYVFCQRNTSDFTKRIHPEGCYREYWIPYKEDSVAYCYVLNQIGERVHEEHLVELATGELELLSENKSVFIFCGMTFPQEKEKRQTNVSQAHNSNYRALLCGYANPSRDSLSSFIQTDARHSLWICQPRWEGFHSKLSSH